MASIIKVLGDEISISSANTVYDANLIRIYAENASVITIGTSGSFTMPAGSVSIVEKQRLETVTSSNTALACPVSYKA